MVEVEVFKYNKDLITYSDEQLEIIDRFTEKGWRFEDRLIKAIDDLIEEIKQNIGEGNDN